MLAAVSLSAGTGTASAHFLFVSPPGSGDGPSEPHHVGQLGAAGHNSCGGHMTASQREQSAAVAFAGPPACPAR